MTYGPAATVHDFPQRWAHRGPGRWRAFVWIFLIYLGYTVSELFSDGHSRGGIAFGCVLLAVFIALYVYAMPYAFAGSVRWSYFVPGAMAAITLVYVWTISPAGLLMFLYVGVALVLALPPRVSVAPVVVMSVGVTVLPQYVERWHLPGLQFGTATSVFFTSLAMYGLRAGMSQNAQLRAARDEVAALATEQERLRIARDLHDLLGHALTTVTLKAELASRLVARDPDRAAAEMAEVAELGRQGLADVRAAVGGYREVSLITELATAREVLRAAGMSAELPAAVDRVPGELRELFGWVVREGVTNVVRHSRAAHVRVCLEDRAIEVVDDGRGTGSAAPGVGLAGLAERVQAAGGRLDSGPAAGRGFRLRVEVPA